MSKLQLKATALYLLYNLELTFKLNPKIIWDECQEAKTEVKRAIFMQYKPSAAKARPQLLNFGHKDGVSFNYKFRWER